MFTPRITLRTQTDDELIEEFLSEVESVQYFERCSELLKKQNELDKNFDFTDEVKKRFSACSRKLKEGMKISNEFYTPLGKAEKILESCRKQFSLINIADVLKGVNIVEVDTPVSEYSEFLFSSVYCKRVNAVLKEALEMLDNNFSSFVANLKCAYSESSEFKKQYTKVAKILSEKGRKDYAATLKNKISSVLVEAELEQKYASVLSDAQRFIAQVNSEIRTLDYNSYREIISAIQGWINTFDCADDMSSVTKSDYLTKLSELKNCVENQKSVLDKEISMVLSEIKNPTVDITRLSEYINNAIRLSPDDDIFMKLKQSGQLLEEFRIMKFESASKDIHEIELDYNERWKGTVCEGYALELINSLKEKISLKRTEWMRRNVTEIHENLSYMSMAQCIKWQSLISELPDYLEDSDLDNVMKLSDLITEKIKSQKIQGVVEMFNALSEHEREECLSILLNKKRQIL